MSYINKPRVSHPRSKRNDIGLTERDYEGGMSTLCAGCGHDSITSALIQAVFEMSLPPDQVVKLSGIGCSSKTPAYFLADAHGLNAVHGRMPSIATGASAANRRLHYIGVSGDGDSLSIGLGQFAHALRRNLDMLYIIENNGVYGLTKGQFSASADIGSRAKRGEVNEQSPIDPVITTLGMGGSFVARSFSGDKKQLVPLIKAGLAHKGFALLDVLSPCVTFNDHEDSTKSYAYTRRFFHPAVHADFVPPARAIRAEYEHGEVTRVQLHDGAQVHLRKVDENYDATHRASAIEYLMDQHERGVIVTGLLYIDEARRDLHGVENTVETPLNALPYAELTPGAAGLRDIQKRYR